MIKSIASSWGAMAAVLLTSGCGDLKTDFTLTVDAVGDFTTPPDTATVNVSMQVIYPGSCEGRSFECSELGADPERSTFKVGPKGALTKLSLSLASDPPVWQGSITGYADPWDISASFGGTSYTGQPDGKVPWPSPRLTTPPPHANQPATIVWTPATITGINDSDHGTFVVTSVATSAHTYSFQDVDLRKNGHVDIPASAFPDAGAYEIRFRRATTMNLTMNPSLDSAVGTFTVELTTQIDVPP